MSRKKILKYINAASIINTFNNCICNINNNISKSAALLWIQTYRSMIFFKFWQICRIIDRWILFFFLIFGMCYRVKKRGWLTRIKNHTNLFYEILNYFVLKIFKKKKTLTQLIIINESQLILVSNQVKLEIMLNREHFTWWHFFFWLSTFLI